MGAEVNMLWIHRAETTEDASAPSIVRVIHPDSDGWTWVAPDPEGPGHPKGYYYRMRDVYTTEYLYPCELYMVQHGCEAVVTTERPREDDGWDERGGVWYGPDGPVPSFAVPLGMIR